MIRCAPGYGPRIVGLSCVVSWNLALFQSNIYLHSAQYETAETVLTMILFVSIIQLRPRPTKHLSYLFAAHAKYDASHEYAECERDSKGVATGRICQFG